MSNQFPSQYNYTQPTSFLQPPTTSVTYTTDSTALDNLLYQLSQHQVYQRLDKNVYIANYKLYINGLDVVRLV